MAEIALLKALPGGLQFVFGVLRSQFASKVAGKVFDDQIVDKITPQLDRIQQALDDLKTKDHRSAHDLFDDALRSMRNKLERISSTSEENLKTESAEIEKELYDARKSAIAASHSNLKAEETLSSLKWIIVTEMLRVLNSATSSKNISSDHLSLIRNRLSDARKTCNKYLQRANETKEITEYISSKIETKGNPKKVQIYG